MFFQFDKKPYFPFYAVSSSLERNFVTSYFDDPKSVKWKIPSFLKRFFH